MLPSGGVVPTAASMLAPGQSPELSQLQAFHRELVGQLDVLERHIFDLETSYLDETAPVGNIVAGWEGYVDRYTSPLYRLLAARGRVLWVSGVLTHGPAAVPCLQQAEVQQRAAETRPSERQRPHLFGVERPGVFGCRGRGRGWCWRWRGCWRRPCCCWSCSRRPPVRRRHGGVGCRTHGREEAAPQRQVFVVTPGRNPTRYPVHTSSYAVSPVPVARTNARIHPAPATLTAPRRTKTHNTHTKLNDIFFVKRERESKGNGVVTARAC